MPRYESGIALPSELGACLRIDQLTLLIGQDSPVATNPAWCGWTYPGRLSKTPLPMAWHDSLLFPVAPLPLTLPVVSSTMATACCLSEVALVARAATITWWVLSTTA